MELNKTEILKVFSNNFFFEEEETPIGTAIKMPSRDAFLFSVVTGAGYFDNPIYPFTPKGLLKLFYNAFDYKFVTGIFDGQKLQNTPYILSMAKPFLFDSAYKYILPVEFDSEIELQKTLKEHFKRISNPTDYLILRVERRKKGNGMEGFMEYLAAEFFKQQGYIVENQIPLAHKLGSPDFGGYKINETIDAVDKYLSLGFHIIELAMIRLQVNPISPIVNGQKSTLIVGEAKTGTTEMLKQLSKYMDTGLFDCGIEIHPSKRKPSIDSFGLLTFDNNLKLVYTPPKYPYNTGTPIYNQSDYFYWLNNYMKFYLIANFTNDELVAFYYLHNNKNFSTQSQIVDFVCAISTQTIVDYLTQTITNGTIK